MSKLLGTTASIAITFAFVAAEAFIGAKVFKKVMYEED